MAPVPAPTCVIPQRRWAAWIIFILVLAGYGGYCAMVVLKAVQQRDHPPSNVVIKEENPTLPDVYVCLPLQRPISIPHGICSLNPTAVIGALHEAETPPSPFQWGRGITSLSTSGDCGVSYSSFPGVGNDSVGCFRYKTYGLEGKRGGGGGKGIQSAVDLVLAFNEGATGNQFWADMCHVLLVYRPVNSSVNAILNSNSLPPSFSSNTPAQPSSPQLVPSVSPSAPSPPVYTTNSSSGRAGNTTSASTPPSGSRPPRSSPSNGTGKRRSLMSYSGRQGKEEGGREVRGGLSGSSSTQIASPLTVPMAIPTSGSTSRSLRGLQSPRILQAATTAPPSLPPNPSAPGSAASAVDGGLFIPRHRVEELQVVGSFYVPYNTSSVYSMSLSRYQKLNGRVTYSFSGTLSSGSLRTSGDGVFRPGGQQNAIVLSLVIEGKGVIYMKEENPLNILTIVGLWGGFWQFALLVLGIFFVSIERQAPHLTVLDPKMLMEGICPSCITEWVRSLCMRKRGRSKYNSNLWEDDAGDSPVTRERERD